MIILILSSERRLMWRHFNVTQKMLCLSALWCFLNHCARGLCKFDAKSSWSPLSLVLGIVFPRHFTADVPSTWPVFYWAHAECRPCVKSSLKPMTNVAHNVSTCVEKVSQMKKQMLLKALNDMKSMQRLTRKRGKTHVAYTMVCSTNLWVM